MRQFLVILTAAFVLTCTPVLAKPTNVSPFIGSWTVDVTRLAIPEETRPKSVTFTFIDSGNEAWTITVDIIDHDGTTHHSSLRTSLDGTPAAIVGSTEADLGAAKMPEPGVLILMLAKGQMPASTRVYTVDADGKRMLETATFFGDKGQPMMRTNYFSRINH